MEQQANGKVKTYSFTFQSTGRVVQLQKVSYLLISQLFKQYDREHPAPRPPKQKVEYPDGSSVMEENRAHPGWVAATEEWRSERADWVEEQARIIYAELGVTSPLTAEEQTAVERVRAQMRAVGVELEQGDRYIYIYHVCVGSPADYGDFVSAVTRRSQPTEEEIAASAAGFPDKIQGA